MPPRRSARSWYTHSYDQPILYQFVKVCMPFIPRPIRFGIAWIVAGVFRRLMPREYAAAQSNITRILPDASPAHMARVTRSLFRHFAYCFGDLLTLNRQPLPTQQRYIYQVHGFAALQPMLESTAGFVALTGHVGNWELAGRLLSPFGKPVNVLGAPEQNAALQSLLREEGESSVLRFVFNDQADSFIQLLMALRRGEIVAVHIDRSTGHRSDMQAEFFGAPAFFPGGPFILAAAAGVPVIPFFCFLRPDRQYEIFIGEAIHVTRGQEAEALQHVIRVLEHYVAKAPDQWFNFYDVWQHAPA